MEFVYVEVYLPVRSNSRLVCLKIILDVYRWEICFRSDKYYQQRWWGWIGRIWSIRVTIKNQNYIQWKFEYQVCYDTYVINTVWWSISRFGGFWFKCFFIFHSGSNLASRPFDWINFIPTKISSINVIPIKVWARFKFQPNWLISVNRRDVHANCYWFTLGESITTFELSRRMVEPRHNVSKFMWRRGANIWPESDRRSPHHS